mgnify:CR=1 FL=1
MQERKNSLYISILLVARKAKENKYAVPQFNINNLEWTKYILEKCNELNIPVILGVSEGAGKYMGGFNVVSAMVKELVKSLNVEIKFNFDQITTHPNTMVFDLFDFSGNLLDSLRFFSVGGGDVILDGSNKKIIKFFKQDYIYL